MLVGSGFSSFVACAAGFRATDDDYANDKEVRFSVSEIVEHR